jgi:23S rRNA (cytidine1920-2'-O)/16S rRNA (cytidine1409-2'-O)-methyltransferase
VREPALRRSAVRRISDVAATIGWGTAGSVASPLPGPSGNVEYFLHLRQGSEAIADDVLDRVIAEGPA